MIEHVKRSLRIMIIFLFDLYIIEIYAIFYIELHNYFHVDDRRRL